MIAIPIDSASSDSKSSKLFGNVELFAIYEPDEERFFFIKNKESGNGIKTAKFLKNWDISSVVYSYMGNGPFNELHKDNIDIYYIGKEPMFIKSIVEKIKEDAFIKVDASNSQTYLDPGPTIEECKCTCAS